MSRKTACSMVFLAFLCWTSLVVPSSAQQFVQVKGTLDSVSAGRNEVFGVDTSHSVWRYHATTKSFGKIAKASLVNVVVGGGTVSQLDEVWGLNSNGSIYRFNYTSKTFGQIPGVLTQIAVGIGIGITDNCHPYEVWGLNSNVIYRYNYCTSGFDIVNGQLTQVATGGGDVWGINSSDSIFHFDAESRAFVSVPGNLVQIAVGVNDVLGVNHQNQLFRYDFGAGTFIQLDLTNTVQVAAGGDGVWFLDNTSDNVYTLNSATASLLSINGLLKSVAVGSGAGVFGINNSDEVFTFVRP